MRRTLQERAPKELASQLVHHRTSTRGKSAPPRVRPLSTNNTHTKAKDNNQTPPVINRTVSINYHQIDYTSKSSKASSKKSFAQSIRPRLSSIVKSFEKKVLKKMRILSSDGKRMPKKDNLTKFIFQH
ncbi:uncharacterized protein LOC103515615 [Diaphorina citri]|uniref:Uncharacterized protein LOC103515615 n=1 Tax=Diaphorina citri TaxID=121845 RepID=A0A1S3DDG1_DIACI|nr:uncharacterized protein LOC103515615 [Diaphorina citri]